MDAGEFTEILGSDFFTGVPDSQLKALCDHLMERYGTDPRHHIIAANEGNSVAIAAGHHLATGDVPVVYMQNSGQGNAVNPIASLMNDHVYGIPCIFVIGWRGEPGTKDEPQHAYQGKITMRLLDDLGIPWSILTRETTEREVRERMEAWAPLLEQGRQVAFVVSSGALTGGGREYGNGSTLRREDAVRRILAAAGDDPVISTTGKTSRELFEIREADGQGHGSDFLTVGSMGHSSSIALGVAVSRPDSRVWCIDGDGAAIMHMGAMAVIGSLAPGNMVHVVMNNASHESVGGMPTAAGSVSMAEVARACGYPYAVRVKDLDTLDSELGKARERGCLSFIEVECAIASRPELGRPTATTMENKRGFMEHLMRPDGRPTDSAPPK